MTSRTARSRFRAAYIDTDQGGVVHHSCYFRWFEIARIELLREGGLVYSDWERTTRLALPVVDVFVRYHRPVRFDDVVEVETWVGAASRAALRFDYRVTVLGQEHIANEAQIRLACVQLEGGTRKMPPEVLLATLGADYEGQLTTTARTKLGR